MGSAREIGEDLEISVIESLKENQTIVSKKETLVIVTRVEKGV